MSDSTSIAKWKDAALAVGEPRTLSVPIRVLLGESVEAAKFVEAYWEPGPERPGLLSAGARLPRTIAEEILSLRDAVQDAETEYLKIVEPKVDTEALKARGTQLLTDITATLEWHLDDGVETDEDVQLAQIRAAHKKDTGGADSLAQALHDYASLARPMAAALDGLGGFQASSIDEALRIADSLGEVSQTPGARSEKSRDAKLLRDRLVQLLNDRVGTVRAAARFVFRNQPQIAKIPASAYERRRRAESRRAAASAATE